MRLGMPLGLAAAAAAAIGLLLAAHGALAQPVLSIAGRVAQPRTVTLAELQAMPAVAVEVTYAGAQGPQTGRFTGALLWSLVEAAAPVDADGPRTRLQHGVLARGRDGYAVLLAIGELSPEFEGKPVLVAYAQDGKPLPVLRLVVPADKRAGRAVRDLVALEIN